MFLIQNVMNGFQVLNLTLEPGFTFLSGAGAVQNVKASPNFCSTHIRIYDGKGKQEDC